MYSAQHNFTKCSMRSMQHYCSELGTRFDSIMSAMWDHPILSTRARKCSTSQDDPFLNANNMDHPGSFHILAYNFKTYERIHTRI